MKLNAFFKLVFIKKDIKMIFLDVLYFEM